MKTSKSNRYTTEKSQMEFCFLVGLSFGGIFDAGLEIVSMWQIARILLVPLEKCRLLSLITNICARSHSRCALEEDTIWDGDFLATVDNNNVTYPVFVSSSTGSQDYSGVVGKCNT